jgi:DivIVA domain-containing protein
MNDERIILTPQDILDKDFKVDARGYRPQEVDKFLDLIIKDYTEFNNDVKRLTKENEALTLENNRLRSEIRHLKELEDATSETGSTVTNVDLLKRISQLEKTVYGKNI